ncbi:MAG: DUF3524 domain-containing protein [bacterium]|nr:DUF3524 domain-containing protein [bacterium]
MNEKGTALESAKVLALEPYYGGSHKSFLNGLIEHSRHEWEILTLPPFKWKWRMRHAPVTFNQQLSQQPLRSHNFDLIFCSDMLNLPEFVGLARPELQQLPSIIYFHENQLTYPFRDDFERDRHFAFSNFSSALKANEVWFNSEFHQEDFLGEMKRFLKKMPDFNLDHEIDTVRSKARVMYPGIKGGTARQIESRTAPRILWAARWEHDKNPTLFFDAVAELKKSGIDFRLAVLGENFSDVPEVFASARREFSDQIDHFGYLESRAEYEAALNEADIFVSTADHEFFGLSLIEAVDSGCWPLLPNRLSYPELIDDGLSPKESPFFYDGTGQQLVSKLSFACQAISRGETPMELRQVTKGMDRFHWSNSIQEYDRLISRLATNN